MRNVFFVLFVSTGIFLSDMLVSQNIKLDSLERVLATQPANDTSKVLLLYEIAIEIFLNDSDKAMEYAKRIEFLSDSLNFRKGKAESLFLTGLITQKNTSQTAALELFLNALSIFEEINYKQGMLKAFFYVGKNYTDTGNLHEAIIAYNKGIKIAEEIGDDERVVSLTINRSRVYTALGEYDRALEDYRMVLHELKKTNNQRQLSIVYNNMGSIAQFQGNYPLALEYFYKTLTIREELGDDRGRVNALRNFGSVLLDQNRFDEALIYQQQALEIALNLKDKRMIAGCYQRIGEVHLKTNNPLALQFLEDALIVYEELSYALGIINASTRIGEFYFNKGDNHKALEYYRKALPHAMGADRKRVTCEVFVKMGFSYLKQKNYLNAQDYAQKALEIADDMQLLSFQRDIRLLLSEVYGATGNFAKAYANHKLYTTFNDSINKEENRKRIIELEYTHKFDQEKREILTAQKQKDIEQAAKRRQQRVIIASLLFCVIFVSLLALYIHRLYRFKHQANLLLTKQKNDIQELNEELTALNEELTQSNEQLFLAKEVIQERENLLTQITDNVPAFISLINSDMQYVFANSGYAQLNGFNKKALIGKHTEQVVNADFALRAKPFLARALKGESVLFENYIENGEEKTFIHCTYLPYYFNSNLQGVLVCNFDITQRKLAEQALRELEQERKRFLEQEIERINQELEYNQKALTAASLKLIQNSEHNAETIKKLEFIAKNTNSEGRLAISSLISNFKQISQTSNWEEFELYFQKVHSSFYEKLTEQFPDLSGNERKLCAFIKLNMSTKDIANITLQTEEALKKARKRLRQKLGIDRETNLSVFMQNI